ncbi:hypothetical protein PISMIDRAFT_684522 [Pisolithus microcarpus 441]|uniref:Uncharacterized protein n=1 Tax=Pisolithus microcarpus 441 TaxID=765257 RepID=A0A0C9YN05_9AGAM|nr:hypothetical protein PISMIDRAFT_684522 [Pisolithus microcarpus 441]
MKVIRARKELYEVCIRKNPTKSHAMRGSAEIGFPIDREIEDGGHHRTRALDRRSFGSLPTCSRHLRRGSVEALVLYITAPRNRSGCVCWSASPPRSEKWMLFDRNTQPSVSATKEAERT